MSLFPLKLPPGVVRGLVDSLSIGRYRDSNLIRWIGGVLQPWKGWRLRVASTVTGIARSMITWKDDTASPWCAIGSYSHIYALNVGGTLSDITPAGFTTGRADSSVNMGFGGGLFGRGAFGTPRALTSTPVPATYVTLDTWGQDLLICSSADGKIYEWTLNPAVLPTAVTNAPTGCTSILVTSERILVAIAPGGNPRKLQWSDREDDTDWTPTTTNYAGDIELPTTGRLTRGVQLKGAALYFTNADFFIGSYKGQPLVYGFVRGGVGCGLIAPGAVAAVDSRAMWMSQGSFWAFDGYAQQVPCDVADYVFANLNTSQSAKIVAHHNGQSGEVTWFYPSAGSTECDAYVTYQYREGCWHIGSLARTAGVDQGAFPLPLMMGADGSIWEHEVGRTYTGASEPFAESGPVEIGNGDTVMQVGEIIPDERTVGDVNVTVYVKDVYTDTDTVVGPFAMLRRVFTRFTARIARFRFTGADSADWRVGEFTLDIKPGGRR